MMYKPETKFRVEGTIVYNLRYDGYFKNDIAVNVECRHLPESIQEDVVKTIVDALNDKYCADMK
jgi:hypothetical protein